MDATVNGRRMGKTNNLVELMQQALAKDAERMARPVEPPCFWFSVAEYEAMEKRGFIVDGIVRFAGYDGCKAVKIPPLPLASMSTEKKK